MFSITELFLSLHNPIINSSICKIIFKKLLLVEESKIALLKSVFPSAFNLLSRSYIKSSSIILFHFKIIIHYQTSFVY